MNPAAEFRWDFYATKTGVTEIMQLNSHNLHKAAFYWVPSFRHNHWVTILISFPKIQQSEATMQSAGDGRNASLRSVGQTGWERPGQETQTMGPGKVVNKLWPADMHGKARQHKSAEARVSPVGETAASVDRTLHYSQHLVYPALRMGSWTGKASSFSKKNAPSNCSPVTYWRGITKGNTSWVVLMGKSLFCNFHVYGVCMYMHVFTCRGTHVCVHLEASGSCWKSSLITLLPYLWRQGLLIKPRVRLYG